MKPSLFLSMSTLFLSAMFTSACFAQDNSIAKLSGVTVPAKNVSMAFANTPVSSNVENVFSKYFKDATDLRWTKVNDNYFVSFTIGNQQNTALFKKNGYMINHVSHGYEQNLPAAIRTMIKTNSDYLNYKITDVTNIKQDKRDVWAAYLESDNEIVLVRSEGGLLEEVERIQKQ